jgi:hypothetical protein
LKIPKFQAQELEAKRFNNMSLWCVLQRFYFIIQISLYYFYATNIMIIYYIQIIRTVFSFYDIATG